MLKQWHTMPAPESWSPPPIQLWGPYNGGLEAEPPVESRGRPPSQRVMGTKPHEAETLTFERLMEAHFLKTGNAKNQI